MTKKHVLTALTTVALLLSMMGPAAGQGGEPPCECGVLTPLEEEFDFSAVASLAMTDDSSIDVLVVYSQEAKETIGGQEEMEELVNWLVNETNQSYINSQVNQRVRLVHLTEIAEEEVRGWEKMLNRVRKKNDDHYDEIHNWRDQYGADAVVVMVEPHPDWCGIAYLMDSQFLGHGFADWAFGLVSLEERCNQKTTFAHELGHNFGCHHNPEDT